ncbi:hypothetical protein [Nocardioides sp. W7]|uniref:hypothetical protein n=1 Tax=Nocardioides sp. W7 TaxID=2931390 RepID=UPI001FD540BC|nr:hypothetical protein [Nocardioides sp. W7]
MPTPSWTDEHARLVADSAPLVPTPTEAEVDRVWDVVAEVVTAPAATRRPRRRIAWGVGLAALVLGTSGVAVAGTAVWQARTGEFQTDPESIRLGGPGELIDPSGADYEQVLREEISDIPFPSDGAREIAVADQVRFARRDAAGMEMARARGDEDWSMRQVTGGMRAEAARAAICSWANAWAATTAAGDADGRAEAIEMLEASRTWPAVTDVDALQTLTWKKQWVTDSETGATRREPYLDNTVFAYLPLVVAAARGRDAEAVGRPLVEYTRCVPELMPDLPAAVPAEHRVP